MEAYREAEVPHPYKDDVMASLRAIHKKREEKGMKDKAIRAKVKKLRTTSSEKPLEIPKHYLLRWAADAGLSDVRSIVDWGPNDNLNLSTKMLQELTGVPHPRWGPEQVRLMKHPRLRSGPCLGTLRLTPPTLPPPRPNACSDQGCGR